MGSMKRANDSLINALLSSLQIPGALHKGVSDKLASLAQGKQPDVTGK